MIKWWHGGAFLVLIFPECMSHASASQEFTPQKFAPASSHSNGPLQMSQPLRFLRENSLLRPAPNSQVNACLPLCGAISIENMAHLLARVDVDARKLLEDAGYVWAEYVGADGGFLRKGRVGEQTGTGIERKHYFLCGTRRPILGLTSQRAKPIVYQRKTKWSTLARRSNKSPQLNTSIWFEARIVAADTDRLNNTYDALCIIVHGLRV